MSVTYYIKLSVCRSKMTARLIELKHVLLRTFDIRKLRIGSILYSGPFILLITCLFIKYELWIPSFDGNIETITRESSERNNSLMSRIIEMISNESLFIN